MEMSDAVVYCDAIEVSLRTGPDMDDITGELQRVVERSGVREGHLAATVVGSTGSLTTIEFEPGVVEDLRRAGGKSVILDQYCLALGG
jgi:thiamine phosphate synthase YjbQ (UPF0047 family)